MRQEAGIGGGRLGLEWTPLQTAGQAQCLLDLVLSATPASHTQQAPWGASLADLNLLPFS